MSQSGLQPYEPPTQEPVESPRRYARKGWSSQQLLIAAIYISMAFSGGLEVFSYQNVNAEYASAIVIAIFGTAWAIADARELGVRFFPALRVLHLLFCPFSLLIYLIVSRGFRGLGLAIVHFVGASTLR